MRDALLQEWAFIYLGQSALHISQKSTLIVGGVGGSDVTKFVGGLFFAHTGTRPNLKMVGAKRGRKTKMQTAQ